MIIVRVPLRLSIAGGGTDLPLFYSKFGSTFISAAIDRYIYITYHRSQFDNRIRLRYSKMEEVESVEDIQNEIIRETFRVNYVQCNVELTSHAEIPSGTGLGSSGSFGVGILHALKGENITERELAEQATDIQMNILHHPIGVQDQYVAAFGGTNVYRVEKNGAVDVSPIDISGLENKLVLFFTGIKRDANDVLANSTIDGLDKIQELAFEAKEVLESGNLHRYGEILNEHWKYKKMRGGMTNRDIDLYYSIGMNNGAVGGKLVGAGGGGFLLFYTEDREKLISSLPLPYVPFKFEYEGSKIIHD